MHAEERSFVLIFTELGSSIEGAKRNFSRPKSREFGTAPGSTSTTPESKERSSTEKSSADSVMSYETKASSVGTIPPLQTKPGAEDDGRLEPLIEDDPGNFDLVGPDDHASKDYSLEARSEKILSKEHLQAIFSDPALLNKFTAFLSAYKPKSLPLLVYYLDALKALRAINYANAVAEALEPIDDLDFTSDLARPTINTVLEEKAQRAFDQLAQEDLPAGKVRYFIGSQVDVSGLAKECTDLPALRRLLAKEGDIELDDDEHVPNEQEKDEFQALSEMFNQGEIETVRKTGGNMHREHVEDDDTTSMYHQPRLLIKDSPPLGAGSEIFGKMRNNGKLAGIYSHYLLVRPAPSLRILFTSPSLRVPGILQSAFMDRIGGSSRVREELEQALASGRGVTAKVRWLASMRSDDEGRSRWIHCTPLLGQNGSVGVWMIVLVDDHASTAARKFRPPPAVSRIIGGNRQYNNSHVGVGGGGANRSEPRSPSMQATARGGGGGGGGGPAAPAPSVGRGRNPVPIIDSRAVNSKFERALTEDEFDRQIEERDRLLGLGSPPLASRSPRLYDDQLGRTASPHPPGTAGSGANSMDSFRI
ncbi:putative hisactophilin c49s mutant phototropin phy3 fusion protein [Diplodia seriata]|uniref:Putative hisactophilin c49s mutant phototropin phy3 fusion protein n=1 Tax=Diplodia seriata TaxID=420778 RepID=A0A0G2ELP9_9PEZI|nr:putative hisactophilin c49s mutant phototropin phy3 fusion protein [Diplodia seriata]